MDLAGGEESSIRSRHTSWASVKSPAKGNLDDGGERPPFVLIEPYAYIANCINATTATAQILYDTDLKGCSIQFTFIAVHPPDVSYLCAHGVGLGDSLVDDPPSILTTETDGSLLMLRVPIDICSHSRRPCGYVLTSREEYFVYDPRVPVLRHLEV